MALLPPKPRVTVQRTATEKGKDNRAKQKISKATEEQTGKDHRAKPLTKTNKQEGAKGGTSQPIDPRLFSFVHDELQAVEGPRCTLWPKTFPPHSIPLRPTPPPPPHPSIQNTCWKQRREKHGVTRWVVGMHVQGGEEEKLRRRGILLGAARPLRGFCGNFLFLWAAVYLQDSYRRTPLHVSI